MAFRHFSAIASGVVCVGIASVAGLVFGLPLAAGVLMTATAGVAAAGTSLACSAIISKACDGKGPAAGFGGMFAWAAAHVTVVPAIALVASKCILGSFNAAVAEQKNSVPPSPPAKTLVIEKPSVK